MIPIFLIIINLYTILMLTESILKYFLFRICIWTVIYWSDIIWSSWDWDRIIWIWRFRNANDVQISIFVYYWLVFFNFEILNHMILFSINLTYRKLLFPKILLTNKKTQEKKITLFCIRTMFIGITKNWLSHNFGDKFKSFISPKDREKNFL